MHHMWLELEVVAVSSHSSGWGWLLTQGGGLAMGYYQAAAAGLRTGGEPMVSGVTGESHSVPPGPLARRA